MDYLPRYSVIESAERYTEIIWESIRNRALGSGQTAQEAAATANADLFSGNGFNPKYNMWNAAGDALIDPATGKFLVALLGNTILKIGEIMLSRMHLETK